MSYEGDPLAQKLDRFAEATGWPRLQRKVVFGNPVRFRMLPLLLITLAIAGLGLQIMRPNAFGYVLITLVWSATIMVSTFGPLGAQRGFHLDERETAVMRNGHFAGLFVAFGVAVTGTFAFGVGKIGATAGWWNIWTPQTGLDWLAVTFFLLAVEANVAVLAASAATPEPLQDEGE